MSAPAFDAVAAVLSYIGARGEAPEDDVLRVLAAREEEYHERAEKLGLDVHGRGGPLSGVRLLADLVAAGRLRRREGFVYTLSAAEIAQRRVVAGSGQSAEVAGVVTSSPGGCLAARSESGARGFAVPFASPAAGAEPARGSTQRGESATSGQSSPEPATTQRRGPQRGLLAAAISAWLDVPAERRAEVVADLRAEAETHRDDAATRRALRDGVATLRTASRDLSAYEARAQACAAAVDLLTAIDDIAAAAGPGRSP